MMNVFFAFTALFFVSAQGTKIWSSNDCDKIPGTNRLDIIRRTFVENCVDFFETNPGGSYEVFLVEDLHGLSNKFPPVRYATNSAFRSFTDSEQLNLEQEKDSYETKVVSQEAKDLIAKLLTSMKQGAGEVYYGVTMHNSLAQSELIAKINYEDEDLPENSDSDNETEMTIHSPDDCNQMPLSAADEVRQYFVTDCNVFFHQYPQGSYHVVLVEDLSGLSDSQPAVRHASNSQFRILKSPDDLKDDPYETKIVSKGAQDLIIQFLESMEEDTGEVIYGVTTHNHAAQTEFIAKKMYDAEPQSLDEVRRLIFRKK